MDCLPGKRLALVLCPQPGGHLEFLPKLAQVPVSSATKNEKVINYKENQEYQQEYGLSSQDAHDAQDERYSNPNIKDNSPFTVLLDFERLPFVELGLINAGELGGGMVPDFSIHIWPPSIKSAYHRFHSKVNSIRRPEERLSLDERTGQFRYRDGREAKDLEPMDGLFHIYL